ncbi:MAG: DUF11 domain-containing protein, partial [Lachnospiraceae bacterium]|nr:DUF11 domain-containing protein [Lachnospiraceae bacterium]
TTDVEEKEAWTVEKTVSGMSGGIDAATGIQKASVGDTLTYTITIANTGNVAITKPVTDTFTVDGEEVSLSLSQAAGAAGGTGSYDADAKTVTLAKGETVVLTATYTVTVTDNTLVNTAVAGDADDTNPPEDTVTTEVENRGSLLVTKTGDDSLDYMVGDTVIYTITVENTGNCTLTNVEVTDSLADAVFEDGTGYTVDSSRKTAAIASLAERAVVTLTVSYVVTDSDVMINAESGIELIAVYNKATATGEDPDGNPVTDSGDVWVPYEEVNRAWTVSKTVSGMSGEEDETTGVRKAAVGDTLVYTITVENTGNVIVKKTLTDTFTVDGEDMKLTLAQTSGEGTYDSATGLVTLDVGETLVLEATYTVTATNNTLVNAVVVGDDEDTDPPGDEVTVEVEDTEAWTVEKTVTGMNGEVNETTGVQSAAVGDKLTYTITIANTGNVTITKPVTDTFTVDGKEVTLSLSPSAEDASSNASGTGIYDPDAKTVTLAEGESIVLTAAYTVTATDNKLVNTVIVGDPYDPETPGDEVTTEVEEKEAWTVEKTVSGMSGAADETTGAQSAAVGDKLLYTIMIANTGNVTITKPVTDTFTVDGKEVTLTLSPSAEVTSGSASGTGTYDPDAKTVTLAEGETIVLTATYIVTATDNRLVNAVVVGDPDDPETPGDEVTTEVENTEGWTVEKTVTGMNGEADDTTGVQSAAVGDKLTYTITIVNTGNVTVTKPVTDTFSVDGKEVTLSLSPSAEGTSGSASGIGTYDPDAKTVTLAEGETIALTAVYTVTATDNKLVNTVLVGDPDDPETPGDEVTTDVEEKEAWTVEKTVSGMNGDVDTVTGVQKALVGDILTYIITIANTGNVTITKPVTDTFMVDGEEVILTLSQASAGTAGSGTYDPDAKTVTLAEGETVVLTAVYTVTVTDSKLVNTVIVGDADDTNPPEDTVTTEVENHGSLSVTKTADAAMEYMVGDTVIYTITVENTGNCNITNIEVVDSLAGAVFEKGSGYMVDSSGKTATIASLAEGEVVTLTVSYIVTESDVVVNGTSGTAAVEIYNKATATGEDPDGNPVTDSGDVWLPYEMTNAAWTVTKTVNGMSGEIDETTGVQKAVVGDTLVYTITVANTGNVIINKTLTDTFTVDGKEIRLTLTKASGSGSYDSATGQVTLGVGETVVLTSTYTVTAAGCKLVNSVLVGDPDDPETPGDEVTIDVENEESWTVEKTVSGMSGEVDETTGAQKAVVGDTLTYTITIANTGTVAIAKNVTDIFTVNGEISGLTLSKSSGSGTYNSATGQVILEAGETIVLTSTYTVTATDNSLVNA